MNQISYKSQSECHWANGTGNGCAAPSGFRNIATSKRPHLVGTGTKVSSRCLQQILLTYNCVSGVFECVADFVALHSGNGLSDRVDEFIEGPRFDASHNLLDVGKDVFDGIQVR
jgi:hypothetical protein